MADIYLQYGCGLSAPSEWYNFDASPTLRLQKLPFVGSVFKKKVDFPKNVRYGKFLPFSILAFLLVVNAREDVEHVECLLRNFSSIHK